MTHTGCMADDKYLTTGGVLLALAVAMLDRLACVRKGHDPVTAQHAVICRRCLTTVARE